MGLYVPARSADIAMFIMELLLHVAGQHICDKEFAVYQQK